MKLVKPAAAVLGVVLFTWLLSVRWGKMPALGKILSPTTGLWVNAESKSMDAEKSVTVHDINSQVDVKYDKTYVPHIFAANDHDLYFTQGYITAKDRLWQMESQSKKGAGKLCELFGKNMVWHDMFYRRIGLAYGAERAIEVAMKDPQTKLMLEAYTAGVNAYIDQLSPADYPVEYKLYDCKPAKWEPVNCLMILNVMAERLTGGEPEFEMSNALKRFGPDTLRELFRKNLAFEDPVIPKNTHWAFSNSLAADSGHHIRNGQIAMKDGDGLGSNNWAIAGSKSASGYPILANDPHLELSMPALWYQVQLQTPEVNVYGVSIPGVPGVVIGFNNYIAWGQTNAAVDVVDWYREKFKDNTREEYWYDNKWNKTVKKILVYDVKNNEKMYDTIFYTHHGPVVYDGMLHQHDSYVDKASTAEGFSMKWSMHDAANNLKTTYLLNRAKNYDDYKQALTFLHCPAQNFVFADIQKNIAINCDGKIPIRYKSQGLYVLDGTNPKDDWGDWIPMDQLPAIKNPERGFVSSANQALTDSSYPYNIEGRYASFARAKRINDKLRSASNMNVEMFRQMQNDSYSEIVADVMPDLLRRLDKQRFAKNKAVIDEMEKWDYVFSAKSKAATFFMEWWHEFYDGIFEDNMNAVNITVPWPNVDRTTMVLKVDTNSYWIDNIRTPEKETLTDIVNWAFGQAIAEMEEEHGPMGPAWEWSTIRQYTLRHVSDIDAFNVGPYEADGGPNTINALVGGAGPSWRMIVEMGPTVKAYGALPGGQSGNPGSFYYDNLFQGWRSGKLNELIFFPSKTETGNQVLSTLTLKK